MTDLLMVVAGGVGAVARYGVGAAVLTRWGGERPMGTAIVNVVGAFLLGVLYGTDADGSAALVFAGFLGGFTTFSTWMVETVVLALGSGRRDAAVNVGLMVVLGVGAAALGAMVG